MNLSNPISSIMTTELITVRDITPVKKLKNDFFRKSIHHLLVEDANQKLLGIISSEDFLRSGLFPAKADRLLARHIMTASPTKMKPDDSILAAIDLFLDNYFRAIPIVDDEDTLVGIVTPYDLMALMAGRMTPQPFSL